MPLILCFWYCAINLKTNYSGAGNQIAFTACVYVLVVVGVNKTQKEEKKNNTR